MVVTLSGLLVRNIDLIFYFLDLFVFDLLLKVGCQIVYLLIVYLFIGEVILCFSKKVILCSDI